MFKHNIPFIDTGKSSLFACLSPRLRYSVVVSTPDSESGNPGSNPGTANHFVGRSKCTFLWVSC